MATVDIAKDSGWIIRLGAWAYQAITVLGDWTIFAGQTLAWMVRRRPAHRTLLTSCHDVGVRSVVVIMITGTFIGMVLAVQAYAEFHNLGMETRMGTLINVSVVRELGPVLAATMLAGRVGSAMAAELATMRISEQIDALSCLGANPIHYLVVPRFIACVLVIPLLTIVADFMGVMGGAFISTQVYSIEAHHYWSHSQSYVGMWDIGVGLIKSLFFGAAIGLVSCHRGFNAKPGSQGVGRAATEAFVASFIAILALDFTLAISLNGLHDRLWPSHGSKLI
jgi:phospholipid/cholesterol/gamma-HCH transport system permease protein